MSGDFQGRWWFENVGPGMTAFRVELPPYTSVGSYLKQIKLVKKSRLDPDVEQFLNELGYTNVLYILLAMKKDGLVMPAAKAIEFRLRFL